MSNLNLPKMTYATIAGMLDRSGRESVKLAFKTTAERYPLPNNPSVVVSHHKSGIAIIGRHAITLTNAGWHSRTTADRLNAILRDNGLELYSIRIKEGRMQLLEYHTASHETGGKRPLAHTYTMNGTFHFARATPSSHWLLYR